MKQSERKVLMDRLVEQKGELDFRRVMHLGRLREREHRIQKFYNEQSANLTAVIRDVQEECSHLNDDGTSAKFMIGGMGEFCEICNWNDY